MRLAELAFRAAIFAFIVFRIAARYADATARVALLSLRPSAVMRKT